MRWCRLQTREVVLRWLLEGGVSVRVGGAAETRGPGRLPRPVVESRRVVALSRRQGSSESRWRGGLLRRRLRLGRQAWLRREYACRLKLLGRLGGQGGWLVVLEGVARPQLLRCRGLLRRRLLRLTAWRPRLLGGRLPVHPRIVRHVARQDVLLQPDHL